MRLQGAEMVKISYAWWDDSRVWFVMEPPITDNERTRMTPCTMPKYEGEPLSRVLEIDPGFVEWCAEKITSPWQTEWRDACREVLNY
ncbi:MAG: hypothetical protein DIZ77_08245 [endosymbiont of Seepiophila jonesi]|uniref:Uncharacterized protein n=1 Tax=endosymbiont of Lamellibrachia luymesi TaxID=2200907 RepID=A0A370DRC9_9GAMM|nr:MAG: hypothetical protein DIZ79_15655 [endosymbiont of Lamellibrachia luymesi]RDH92472.1 MAG: hypothetical protein DIZ77_08245 [endosymbiont of Seepiophila jonesi]